MIQSSVADFLSVMGSRQQRKLHCLALVSFLLTSPLTAAALPIRLAGSTQCSGRVEVYYNDQWGTVCDDEWDLNDAEVVCRQLGCGTAQNAPQSAHFGEGTGQIWLDEVDCSGSERSLTECQHRGFGTQDCGHTEDAGVVCSDVPIRLAGSGSTRCSGRVEVHHSGFWGTVCDDNWDLNDAMVVCKQLSCGKAMSIPHSDHFGEGTGKIWLDEVVCSGSERSLTECQHRGFGTHDCNHGEDAGVVCSGRLPEPSISMNPAGVVTWGQDVKITCSVSTQHLGGTFILQKISGSFRKTQTSSTKSSAFSILKVNFDNEGSYQCQYEKTISGYSVSTRRSDFVTLSVTVSFPKARISMNPAAQVAWGQNIDITCSVSTQHLGGTFILQKTSGSFTRTQTSSTNSATFNILKVNFDNEGLYQCQYKKRFSLREFSSPQSNSVRLSLTVPLQQPNISLTSPNGGLVWGPEGAEVTRGYSFIITCSINSSYPGGVFSLIFSGSNITDTKPAVNHSASFNFPVAEYEHQGNYSCVYEVTLSSRKFTSPETEQIIVVIKLSLLLLVSSVAVGLLLLLLLVLLVVCLVFRRRRRAKQPAVLYQTQSARVGNFYERDDVEEEEEGEEEDYVNVDLMDFKKNLKEEAGRVGEEESDDYEEPESDEDHDYEEAGPDANFTTATEFCFSVEENRGEDEEEEEEEEEEDEDEDETSDDEADYENVT